MVATIQRLLLNRLLKNQEVRKLKKRILTALTLATALSCSTTHAVSGLDSIGTVTATDSQAGMSTLLEDLDAVKGALTNIAANPNDFLGTIGPHLDFFMAAPINDDIIGGNLATEYNEDISGAATIAAARDLMTDMGEFADLVARVASFCDNPSNTADFTAKSGEFGDGTTANALWTLADARRNGAFNQAGTSTAGTNMKTERAKFNSNGVYTG